MATSTGDRYLASQPKIRSPPTPIRQFRDRDIHNPPINSHKLRGSNDKPKVKVVNAKVKTSENTGSRIPTKVQVKQTRKITKTATKSNENKEIPPGNHFLEEQDVTLNQPRLNSTKAIGDTLKRLENATAPSIILTDDIKASINSKASHVLNLARNQQRYQSLLPLEAEDSAPMPKIFAPTKPKYLRQSTEPLTYIEDYLPDDYYTEVSPFEVKLEESTLTLETRPVSSAFDFYKETQRWR